MDNSVKLKIMTEKKSPNEALIQIRKTTELTQRDFADAVGSTASTIQLIENGIRNVTPQLAARISAFTGCDPECFSTGEAIDIGGNEYTTESYKKWSRNTPVSEADVKNVARHIASIASSIIEVAAISSTGTPPDQHLFRQVVVLISQSLEGILDRFHMWDALNAKFAAQASAGDWEEISLESARVKFGQVTGWTEIGDSQDQPKRTKIQIRYTKHPVWNPLFGADHNPKSNFAEARITVMKKIEFKVPWKEGVSVMWLRELSTPCGKTIET